MRLIFLYTVCLVKLPSITYLEPPTTFKNIMYGEIPRCGRPHFVLGKHYGTALKLAPSTSRHETERPHTGFAQEDIRATFCYALRRRARSRDGGPQLIRHGTFTCLRPRASQLPSSLQPATVLSTEPNTCCPRWTIAVVATLTIMQRVLTTK